MVGGLILASACSPLPAQRPTVRLENAHAFGSTQVEFSPNGQLLASGGLGGDIKIWSVPSVEMVMTLKVHISAVRGMAWVSDSLLISAGDDGRVVVWDLARKEPRQIRARRFTSSIKGLAFLAESGEIVSGHKDGTVRVLEYPSLRTLRERDMGSRVLALRSPSQGAFLAVSVKGKKVFLLDRELRVVKDLQQPTRNIFSFAFAPDRQQLAGGGWFKISLWDLSSGALEEWDTHHFGKIPSLDYSPDGEEIASIGRISDSKIFLTRRESGELSRYLLRHSLCGTALRFSPDGRYIASTSDDRSVRIYDLSEPYPPR